MLINHSVTTAIRFDCCTMLVNDSCELEYSPNLLICIANSSSFRSKPVNEIANLLMVFEDQFISLSKTNHNRC